MVEVGLAIGFACAAVLVAVNGFIRASERRIFNGDFQWDIRRPAGD